MQFLFLFLNCFSVLTNKAAAQLYCRESRQECHQCHQRTSPKSLYLAIFSSLRFLQFTKRMLLELLFLSCPPSLPRVLQFTKRMLLELLFLSCPPSLPRGNFWFFWVRALEAAAGGSKHSHKSFTEVTTCVPINTPFWGVPQSSGETCSYSILILEI